MTTESIPRSADGTTVIESQGCLNWKASDGELWGVPLSRTPGTDGPYTVSEWDADVNAGPPDWHMIDYEVAVECARVAHLLGATIPSEWACRSCVAGEPLPHDYTPPEARPCIAYYGCGHRVRWTGTITDGEPITGTGAWVHVTDDAGDPIAVAS